MGNNNRILDLKSALPPIPTSELIVESSKSLKGKCPFCGGRDRFVYRIDLDKWHCRGCHQRFGDNIDFEMKRRNVSFKDLMKEYGFVESSNEKILQYMCDERKLSHSLVKEAINDGSLFYMNQYGRDKKQVIGAKFRTLQGKAFSLQFIPLDGSKKTFKKDIPIGQDGFFVCGAPLLLAEGLVVTEGVIDAMSVAAAAPNYCVIAIGGTPFINKIKLLTSLNKTIIAGFDNDKAGQDATAKLSALIPDIKTVKYNGHQEKDFNDFIKNQKSKAIGELLSNAVAATPLPFETKHPMQDAFLPNSNTEEALNDWPEPEPISENLLPVEDFTFDLLPDVLRSWVSDIATRMQCPPDYPGVASMVMLASLIGRKIGIYPKQKDDWLVIPNLWGMIFGRPSELKTPSLRDILKPMRRLEISAEKDFREQLKEYELAARRQKIKVSEAEKKASKAVRDGLADEDIDHILVEVEVYLIEPTRNRYLVNDATVEKLGELLNENINGLLLFRDELSGWLKTINREDRSNDRAFYLETWNGNGRYTYDRIGRGTIDIDNCCLSILGGVQPGKVMSLIRGAVKGGSDDDGLIQRFQLAVYPDRKPWKVIDQWPDKDAKEQAWLFFEAIANMPSPETEDNIPALRFSNEAQSLFYEWLTDLETEIRGDDIHPVLESHLAKYRSLIPSLALLIHLGNTLVIDLEVPVSIEALQVALGWYEYLRSHAERIYGMGTSNSNQGAITILGKIKKGKLMTPFKKRDVQQGGWSGLTESDDIDGALEVLIEYGYVKSQNIMHGVSGGRPSVLYHVNPTIMKEAK